MAINIPIGPIKTALSDATKALIGSMGETAVYTFKDGTPSVTIRLVRQRIREDEIVGTYKNGDCRFTIDATTLPKPPEKFDEILAGDGGTYIIFDSISIDVGIDNTVLAYRPIGRGA